MRCRECSAESIKSSGPYGFYPTNCQACGAELRWRRKPRRSMYVWEVVDTIHACAFCGAAWMQPYQNHVCRECGAEHEPNTYHLSGEVFIWDEQEECASVA